MWANLLIIKKTINVLIFSVHLARRVLQLERENTQLRKELEREIERNKELAEQVYL